MNEGILGCPRKIIHPQKLTWNLEMMVSNRNLLFQGSIFRFHVCFGGCKWLVGWLYPQYTPSMGNLDGFFLGQLTLPETNSEFAPENRPKPNSKGLYSNHPFLGEMVVSWEGIYQLWVPKLSEYIQLWVYTYAIKSIHA